MVNRKLMDNEVGRILEGGYSNAEGGTIAVRTPDALIGQMDTAGLQGIVTKTVQRPVAEVNYNVATTVNPQNIDNRPVQIAADNADAGSRGTADVEPDMIAGEQVPTTYDARSAEETVVEEVTKPVAAPSGLTEQQKKHGFRCWCFSSSSRRIFCY